MLKSVLFFFVFFLFFDSIFSQGTNDTTCIHFSNLSLEETRPVLQYNYSTEHFNIHYDQSSLVDYAYDVGQLAELAYDKMINEKGWPILPPDNNRGGDNNYDIYIENYSAMGETIAEIDAQWNNEWAPSYIKLDIGLSYNGDFQTTVVHEVCHAFQFAYSYRDGYPGNYWFYENCAVLLAEEILEYNYFYKERETIIILNFF